MTALLLALALTLGCGESDGDTAGAGGDTSAVGDSAAGDDGGASTDSGQADGGGADGGADGGSGDTGAPGESYIGPDYQACVTEAQCEPGSACTEVPDHATPYCAPPCDPSGDGSECDLTGTGDMGFDTVCLDNGRCARTCADDAVAAEGDEPGTLVRDPDDTCPESLECTIVDDDGETLCAGPASGAAGYYNVCSHPNVDGPDCPDQSECFGGSYIGLDVGVCLPWCDDGICPAVPDGTTASPLCYDVGLDHPVCALICIPDASECPAEQFCYSFGSIGLCMPDDSTIPDGLF